MTDAVRPRTSDGRPLVVRVIARLNVGGPALQALDLTADVPGYDTLLVHGAVGAAEAEVPIGPELRSRVRHLPGLGRAVRPLDDVRALAALVVLLRRVRPAIVHTHTAKAGALGRIAAVIARVPVRVHTYHGHVFAGYFAPWQTRIMVAVERLLARVTTCIVVLSESQREAITGTHRICSADRVRIIPLGFDLQRFRDQVDTAAVRREIGLTARPVIASVGRLVNIKNHRLLLTAFQRVLEAVPGAQLVLIGDGEERDGLMRLATGLGISGQVTFLGWRSDLPSLYRAADVIVLSSDNEGTPVCLIEALAAGCRVVATDVGGVRDVVGDDGRLVPAGDAGQLAAAIEQALSETRDAGRRKAVADRVVTSYALARLRADVTRMYDELRETR